MNNEKRRVDEDVFHYSLLITHYPPSPRFSLLIINF